MRAYTVSLTIASLALGSFAHGQTYTLRRQFRIGELDKYVCKTKTTQSMGMGGQSMSNSSEQDYSFATKKVLNAGKLADVRMTMTMKVEGMASAMAMMGGKSNIPTTINTDGTIDWRNRFTSKHVDNAWVAGLTSGSMGQTVGVMLELPDHPVRIGDSWNMELPKIPMMGMKMTMQIGDKTSSAAPMTINSDGTSVSTIRKVGF